MNLMKRKVSILIGLLFFTGIVYSQNLEVRAYVETPEGKGIEGAVADVFIGGTKKQSAKTDSKGFVFFKLDFGNTYKIVISKAGMIQKRIDFVTEAPIDQQRNLVKEFGMTLVEDCDGANTSVFNDPVDIVKFDDGFGNFVSDQSHVESMRSKISSAIASIEKCKKDKYQEKKTAADKAFKAGDFSEAEKLYNEALTVFPNDSYAKRQISQSINGQEKQKQKLVQYDNLVAEGEQFLAQNQLKAAQQRFTEATKLNPSDTKAQAKLQEINQIFTQKAQQQQQEQALNNQYNEVLSKANSAMASKNYALAKQLYEEAGKLKPNEAFPAQKLALAQQSIAKEEQEKLERDRIQQSYNEAIASGQSALQQGDLLSAKQQYQKAQTLKPNELLPKQQIQEIQRLEEEKKQQELKAQRDELEKNYSEAIQKADGLLAQKEFDGSIDVYKQALMYKPSDRYAQTQITKASNLKVEEEQKKQASIEQAYLTAMNNGDSKKIAKSFDEAIAAYQQALVVKPNDSQAQSKLNEAQRLLAEQQQRNKEETEQKAKYNQLVQEGDSYFQTQDYTNSKAKFEQALSIYPTEAYPKNKIASINNILAKNQKEAEYNEAIAQADKFFSQQEFEQAIAKYNQAKLILPEKAYPQEKINEISKIVNQQAQDQKQAEYDQLAATAEQKISSESFEEAKSLYAQALRVLPENPYPQQRINEINEMISNKSKSAAEEKYNALASQAEQQVSQDNFEAAKSLYAQASLIIPENPYPKQRINEINEMISNKAKSAVEEEYNKFVTQAEQQVSQENFEAAKSLYAQASLIVPENPYPKQRINEINKMISNKAKSAIEEEYNKLAAQAEQQVSQENFEEAKSFYVRASQVMPENSYPQKRINEINEMISNFSKNKEQEEFDNLKAQAEQAVVNENYNKAKNLLTSASLLMPEDPYPQRRINEINSLIDSKANNQKLEKYNDLLLQADNLFSKQSYPEAKNLYIAAQKENPESDYPLRKINEINQILSQNAREKTENEYLAEISKADNYFNSKQYNLAVSSYTNASRILPEKTYPRQKINEINSLLLDDARVEREKEERKANYDKTIALADKFFAEKNYILSRTEYSKASTIYPNEPYPTNQISKIEDLLAEQQQLDSEKRESERKYREAIAKADELFKQRQYVESKTYYEQALSLKINDPHSTSQIKRINQIVADDLANKERLAAINKKYQDIIANADSKFNAQDYKEARTLYFSALEVKPNEAYPRQQLKKVDEKLKIILIASMPKTTTTAKTTSTSAKLDMLNFKTETERSKYKAELKKKYKPGITLETYKEGNKTTKRYIVIRDNEVHEYRVISFSWGGAEYTVDGKPSNSMYIRDMIKPRSGETVTKVDM